jgi:diguanylate cyclase (GGDEF)-like protein
VSSFTSKMSNLKQNPIPENEPQRLKAVQSYDVLDSAAEVDFDALTRLAAYSLNTPAAVVGLMDSDRLWFKSRLGIDAPQLDRQIAFCAHAIMRPGELLVVEDLAGDERFKDNPLVVNAPHLRFYAGSPLVDQRGLPLGTIAVADTQPREFSARQCEVLRDLSVLAMTALENRKRALMMERLALTDYLTGLSNRAQFDRTLHAEIAHAKRSGEPFSLLCMDLDGFKTVNDQYGHAAGDEVLREVGRRLKEQLRLEDTVSRLGGDEFGVITRNFAQDSAQLLVRRIRQAVTAPMVLSRGAWVSVGISIGLVGYSETIDSAAALLTQADSVLYRLKRQQTKN